MFEQIIAYSVRNKLVVFLMVLLISIGGIYSMQEIPLDAVPDITNNQVQVVTTSPTLAAEEVEQLITFPIEASLSNIPDVVEIRSISRYGLSVITVVFEEDAAILDNRQYVKEQLGIVDIPPGLGNPELMPITTGLGEIYQYVLSVRPEFADRYDIMELRTIQDWIVKRQLAGIQGVIEVSSFGGYVKQYEIALDVEKMFALQVTVPEVISAIEQNNENSGGSYIEEGTNALYIRTFGRLEGFEDIKNVQVTHQGSVPVYVRDIADIQYGSPKRYGAMTMDGKGEVVGGITLMLKGSSSSGTIANVKERIKLVESALPEGVEIQPYLDRSDLIGRAIDTVSKNLIEGGLIVVFVLVLLLGNWRGGLIVASIIPLSMLFAFTLMRYAGVSANLMSLGAIDFGIVVDGAVIIVEAVLHVLYTSYIGKTLSQEEMNQVVVKASSSIYKSAAFGVLIILVVFVPILTLTGIEGKMFRPMALTVSFAILGAMIFSLTYVPVMASLLFKKKIKEQQTFSDRIVKKMRSLYKPSLQWAISHRWVSIGSALVLLLLSGFTFSRMGGEFIPTLEEGDLAMQMTIQPGSSLSESVKTSSKAEKILLENFPEVRHVVSKIGTAEVPTDPMAIEDADIMIILDEKEDWQTATNREDLVEAMKEKLSIIVGASFDFTQPIQLRFNELMTGAKTDIAIQIFGEETDRLARLADRTSELIKDIDGVGDIKVEQTEGLPQMMVTYDRDMLGYYGISVADLNSIIKTAYAGRVVGQIFENERQFDLVLRHKEEYRNTFDLDRLWVKSEKGDLIPISKVAKTVYRESPLQISREDAKRRINVGVNVRNRDVASLVGEIRATIDRELRLPPGYIVKYGGQFENLERAQNRLIVAVPLALMLILVLLYFTFSNIADSLIIFLAVPFSAIGGVFALSIRGMPFSISAGVGFIALFGVSVLNGIVLIQYYRQLRSEGDLSIAEIVVNGGLVRLRPVVMTAAVASLGFLPMALSTTSGAEVQRPLATVVIGGLITSTLLTLFILPIIYRMVHDQKFRLNKALILLPFMFFGFQAHSQNATSLETIQKKAYDYYPLIRRSMMEVDRQAAMKQQSYNPGSLNANLSYGQINNAVTDYNLSVVQPLGNIPQSVSTNKSAKMAISLAQINQELNLRWIQKEVTDAYLDWIYHAKVKSLLSEQEQVLARQLAGKVQGVEAGESSSLELMAIQQGFQNTQHRIATNDLKYQEQVDKLIQFTGMSNDSLIAPKDYPVILSARDTVLSPIFYQVLDQRIMLNEQEVNMEQMGFFPSLSIGYFNQQLEGVKGFDGVMLGAAFPIWFVPQKARVQQRKIELEMTSLENQVRLDELKKSMMRTFHVAGQIEEILDKTDYPDLETLEQSIDRSKSALEFGEIDLFEFTRLINQSFENMLTYQQTRLLQLKTLNELKYYIQ